jgi:probable F420-dependent oxidoreductase
VSVALGIAMFMTDETVAPDDLARMVEERGFESLFVPDHTHIPTSRRTPYPLGELPEYYKRMLDPFLALAFASAATTSLMLGTGVCLVAERDPIVTAKQVATLDRLSGGRLLFGVGAGWNVEEMENHGTDPGTRFALMRERVRAMKEIWTQDEAEYHGELVDFDPLWSWPKPVSVPHPPILIGGGGPKALDRVLDYGDGWAAGMQPLDVLVERCAELRERAASAGRAPLPVTVTANFEPATVEGMRDAGVTRVLTYIEPCGRAAAEAELDRLASLADASR